MSNAEAPRLDLRPLIMLCLLALSLLLLIRGETSGAVVSGASGLLMVGYMAGRYVESRLSL